MLTKIEYFANKNEVDIKSAYILSLYGWKYLHKDLPGVQCDMCFSKKGFYQYKDNESFDALEQHKSYCPWKNPDTANAYTPKEFSTTKNQKINGSDWMKDVITIEYNILMRKEHLSLSSKFALNEKFHDLKYKMHQSYDLIEKWNSAIKKIESQNSDSL